MRACASAGITVFGVGLGVAGPQALQVEGRLERQHLGSGDPVEARGEPFDALVLAHVVEVPEVAAIATTARWASVGGTTPASRPSTAGRPSASHSVASAAIMRCPAFGSRDDTLECESTTIVRRLRSRTTMPLPPAATQGLPRMSRLPPSMSAASASRSRGRRSSMRVEGAAPRLLLALDEVPDAAGQRTDRLQPRLDRPDPRQELALVVRGPAGPDAAVADGGLVGRRRPQLERARRLHVVVLDGGHASAARRRSRRRRAAARRRPRAPRPSPRGAGAARRSSRPRRGARRRRRPRTRSRGTRRAPRSSARGAPRPVGRRRRSRPTRPSSAVTRACGPGRGTAARPPSRRPGRGGPRRSTRPAARVPTRSKRGATEASAMACLRIGLQPCEVALPTCRPASANTGTCERSVVGEIAGGRPCSSYRRSMSYQSSIRPTSRRWGPPAACSALRARRPT